MDGFFDATNVAFLAYDPGRSAMRHLSRPKDALQIWPYFAPPLKMHKLAAAFMVYSMLPLAYRLIPEIVRPHGSVIV